MASASEIIKRCGGPKTVALWLGMERSGVQRWTYEPPRGCGNRIPAKHWAALITAAKLNAIEISLDELVPAAAADASIRKMSRKAA